MNAAFELCVQFSVHRQRTCRCRAIAKLVVSYCSKEPVIGKVRSEKAFLRLMEFKSALILYLPISAMEWTLSQDTFSLVRRLEQNIGHLKADSRKTLF